MAIFQSGYKVEEIGLQLHTLLVDDPWGEAWRASSDRDGPCLFVVWSTSEGVAAFRLAHPRLELLRRKAPPAIARILEIAPDSTYPAIVIKDPGGPTLREHLREIGTSLPPVQAAQIVLQIAGLLVDLADDPVLPFGLSPDNICLGARGTEQWVLLPFPLWTPERPQLIASGAYIPPDIAKVENPETICLDTYSLAVLWYQMLTGSFEAPPKPGTVQAALKLPRLSLVLENNLAMHRGSYTAPRILQTAIQHWINRDSKEDLADVADKARRAKQPQVVQRLEKHSRIVGQVTKIALFFIIATTLRITIPMMFESRMSTKSPYGTLNLFFRALAKEAPTSAEEYCYGTAQSVPRQLLFDIKSMENDHLASKFKEAVSFVQANDGDRGSTRNATATLKGVNGDAFIECEIRLVRQGGEWYISSMLWKRLREKEAR